MSPEAALADVTVILVTYNSAKVVGGVLEPFATAPHVIVVDNGSRDGTPDAVQRVLPQAQVIELGMNIGFGRANNRALEVVTTSYSLLLNPDCRMAPEALRQLVEAAQRYPDAAILAPRLYDPDGALGMCYRPAFFHPQPRGLADPAGDLCSEFLTGAAMMLRMDLMRRVGFFDPWFFLYYEDDDLCLRTRGAGHSLVLVHAATAIHYPKTSSPPSLRLSYRRMLCLTSSKLFMLRRHVGTWGYRRALAGALLGGIAALIGASLTGRVQRAARSLGRLVGAATAPWRVRRAHCIERIQ